MYGFKEQSSAKTRAGNCKILILNSHDRVINSSPFTNGNAEWPIVFLQRGSG